MFTEAKELSRQNDKELQRPIGKRLANSIMQNIGFGGGCHWCTEAVFQSLKGVSEVRQGFIASAPPDDDWSEAVDITFDTAVISIQDLLNVHLVTHASTSNHKMRIKYRSAVYVVDSEQRTKAEKALLCAATESDAKFVTRVLTHSGFKPSSERFQHYYQNNPEKPFCRTYINPKLNKLRDRFSELLKQGA